MMQISIAPLHPEQHRAVAQLFHDVWHETQAPLQDARQARARPLAFFQSRIARRAATTLVGSINANIAGFAAWEGNILHSLFVAQSHRHAGLGQALCQAAEAAMAQAGALSFELNCVCGNEMALRFYERNGWRLRGVEALESETPEGHCHIQVWRMVKTKHFRPRNILSE